MTTQVLVIGFTVFFLFLIVAMPMLWWALRRAGAPSYGPESAPPGPPRATGALVCETWKAPVIGKKPRFPYDFKVYAAGDEMAGIYAYTNPRRQKAIYSGEVLLSHEAGQVRGRARMNGTKVFLGEITEGQADLSLGFGAESVLRFLNGRFQFGLQGDRVRFIKTDQIQAVVHRKSKLTVESDRIYGYLAHSRESWVVKVDVAYKEGVEPVLLVLTILLAGSDILSYHHD